MLPISNNFIFTGNFFANSIVIAIGIDEETCFKGKINSLRSNSNELEEQGFYNFFPSN